MAAAAKYRDDMSGNLVLGGTSTAYTISTNQVLTALTDGFSFWARINATSGADPTLAVDGLTAKQIRKVYGTNVPTGALLINSMQKFTYDASDDAWIVGSWMGTALLSGDNPDLVAIEAIAGTSGALKKTAANTWDLDNLTFSMEFIADGYGNVLATGILGDLQVPIACTITGAFAYADQSGSAVVDVWKDTHAQFPPTDADSITASAPITISTATKASDTTLTGWTVAVTAGDVLRFNLDSITSITRLTVVIRAKRFT
jgi:hypothetical protein